MKALVVAPQPFFSPRGTPLSVYHRTRVSAELGVEIDLLTYGEGLDVEIPGVTIHRIPRFRFLEPVVIGPSKTKLWLDLFIVIWTLGRLLRQRYDFVHAHEESVFFLRFFKPIFQFKLVYDMHSSLPQQLENFSFTRSRMLIGAFEFLENTCLRNADAVITICPELRDYAVPRMPEPERHFLIENSLFDDVRLKDGASAGKAPEMKPLPEGRDIVAYAGTFESYQGIEVLVRGFARAREQRPGVFLLMVGGTPEQVELYRKMAGELGLEEDCLFTGRVDQSSARRYLGRARLQVSPRTEGTNTPLKIYEQLANGIPLIATRILSHTQILDDGVCVLVDPDPSSMAEGILAALNDTARCDRLVANAKALYAEKYARRAYMEKMQSLLGLMEPCAASLGS